MDPGSLKPDSQRGWKGALERDEYVIGGERRRRRLNEGLRNSTDELREGPLPGLVQDTQGQALPLSPYSPDGASIDATKLTMNGQLTWEASTVRELTTAPVDPDFDLGGVQTAQIVLSEAHSVPIPTLDPIRCQLTMVNRGERLSPSSHPNILSRTDSISKSVDTIMPRRKPIVNTNRLEGAQWLGGVLTGEDPR